MPKSGKFKETLADKGPQTEPPSDGRSMLVPRSWLIGLSALVVVPWLVVAGVYVSSTRAAGPEAATGSGSSVDLGPTTRGEPNYWGQLDVTPIMISPPMEYVPTNWGQPEPLRWLFPKVSRQDLEPFLLSAGVDREQVARLISTARDEPRIAGLAVSPDPEFVRKLNRETRAAIYLALSRSPLNVRQHDAYRNFSPNAETWLGNSLISRNTFDLVKPYIYGAQGFLYFADIDPVRAQLGDNVELQRLAKVLMRESTVLVELRVPNTSEVDKIAEYWGRGGRRTDIRPLLESIAAGGAGKSIDIAHLLPTMARQHLYRYPKISLKELVKPAFEDCFWTAMNFFNPEPDDRFLKPETVFERLKSGYYIVHDKFQLGDVVIFADDRGNYFHAAVYLADNLVFGKNGTSSLSPWTIVPIERLKAYYIDYIDQWNVTYYRRNDL